MSDYRRWFVSGGTFFFTVVANERRRILTSDRARPLLRKAMETARSRRPFSIVAFVLTPDHFHAVLTLPAGDCDYSTRLRHVKSEFTRDYPWSSFHRYVQMGEYDIDWGGTDPCPGWNQPE